MKAETFENIRGRPPLVSISQRQDNFIFTVETSGALLPVDVVVQGLQVLRAKLDEVAQRVLEEDAELGRSAAEGAAMAL